MSSIKKKLQIDRELRMRQKAEDKLHEAKKQLREAKAAKELLKSSSKNLKKSSGQKKLKNKNASNVKTEKSEEQVKKNLEQSTQNIQQNNSNLNETTSSLLPTANPPLTNVNQNNVDVEKISKTKIVKQPRKMQNVDESVSTVPLTQQQQIPIENLKNVKTTIVEENLDVDEDDEDVEDVDEDDEEDDDDEDVDETTVVNSKEVEKVLNQAGKTRNPSNQVGNVGAGLIELQHQLALRMISTVLKHFKLVYKRVKGDEGLFRKEMLQIPLWNANQISHHATDFVNLHEDIITVFEFAYAANLMLVADVLQREETSTSLEIPVVPFTSFVHRVFVELSRPLYEIPSILDDTTSMMDQVTARKELMRLCNGAIADSISLCIKMESLTELRKQDFQNEKLNLVNMDDEEEDDNDDDEIVSKIRNKKLLKGRKKQKKPILSSYEKNDDDDEENEDDDEEVSEEVSEDDDEDDDDDDDDSDE